MTWKYGHMTVYGVQLHVASGTLVVVISNLSGDQELVVVIQNLYRGVGNLSDYTGTKHRKSVVHGPRGICIN